MRNRILKVDASDNVLIALTDLNQREQIAFSGNDYTLVSDIPAKHKFATEDLAIGADVIMYGVIVGRAVKPVRQGERLTTSNIRHQSASFHQQSQGYRWAPPDVSRWKQQTFLGYRRSDGQVGTRNYWLVVPLVFCENRNIIVLKQAFEEELGFAAPQVYRHS
jgi:altronate hydrolase